MKEENKAVKTEGQVAAPVQEVDYEALLKQKDEELLKVREEKENYRKGMLKAKGKLPDDAETDNQDHESVDSLIEKKVKETFLSTREAQIQAEKDAAIAALAKRNRELEVALKNRGQITSATPVGTNQEIPVSKVDSYFSEEQIRSLKAKGYDDKKIERLKQNMIKGNQSPR